MNRPSLVIFALGVGLLALPAWADAPDEAACCVQTTSALDAAINPIKYGDEKFFTISGAMPNVLFAIDTSGSMDWWPNAKAPSTGGSCSSPCTRCTTSGCDCLGTTGYNPDVTYPPEIASFNTASGHLRLDGQGGRTGWFRNDIVYEFKLGEGYGNNVNVNPSSDTWSGATRDDAIFNACDGIDESYVAYSPQQNCGYCDVVATNGFGASPKLGYGNGTCSGGSGTQRKCRGQRYYGTQSTCQPGTPSSCANGTECTSGTSKCSTKWSGTKCYNFSTIGRGIGCYKSTVEDAVDNDGNDIYCSTAATATASGCSASTDECSQSGTGDYYRVCKYFYVGPAQAACRTCLATKGYYHNPGNLPSTGKNMSRVLGNFLNTYSPRFHLARRVVKEVLAEANPIRIAGSNFSQTSTGQPNRFYSFYPACSAISGLATPTQWDAARNNFVTSLNAAMNVGGGTPLLRTLVASGYMFTDQDSVFNTIFGTNWKSNVGITTSSMYTSFHENEPVCEACTGSFNAIVLMTDGVGSYETGLSTNNNLPANLIASGRRTYNSTECSDCQSSDLDEVAYILHTRNLKSTSSNPRYTNLYTVGFGLGTATDEVEANNLLSHAANVGGGLHMTALNGAQLTTAFETIFTDISKRSTSFSTTSISSMQTGTEKLTAIMPRMSPNSSGIWTGQLYRFGLYNEFVEGGTTDATKLHPQRVSTDPIPSIFIIDKNNNIVQEDPIAHAFLKRNDQTRATPFWEASAKLVDQVNPDNREIYTVIDCAGTNLSTCTKDGYFNQDDQVIEFIDDNWQILSHYMGIRGSTGADAYCPTSSGKGKLLTFLNLASASAAATYLGMTWPASPTQLNYDELCARVLINYVRGQDLGGTSDPTRLKIRTTALADIFHSSPIVVGPPADAWICDLGLNNQCLRTLYAQNLPTKSTPLASVSGTKCNSTATTRDAYSQFSWNNGTRDKLVLVATNDGMLHAFHNGTATTSCDAGLRTVEYDEGTGSEVWAFIPPDVLPRLKDVIKGHQYLVDGDTMVRDVWNDDNNDGIKQDTEFKTVAITALGRGGNSYFALDLTKSYVNLTDRRGFFRWMFPQPCTNEATMFGKTLLPITPRPPPIGPVILETSASATNKVDRYGKTTEERWVAVLSGGWSPRGDKGRGIYMVDAWRGKVANRNDNLIWKFEQPANSPTLDRQQAASASMTSGFAAPVSLVDYGANDKPKLDGFFDTAIVGDMQGQIWVARFYAPGTVSTTASPYLVTNWAAARAFEQDRDSTGSVTSALSGESSSAVTGPSIANRNPIFSMASTALQLDNNALRVLLGTGDRMNLLDSSIGECRFDEPYSCAKYGCETRSIYEADRLTMKVTKAETHLKDSKSVHAPYTTSTSSLARCGNVYAEMDTHDLTCPKVGGGTISFNDMPRTNYACTLTGSTDKVYNCTTTDPVTPYYGAEDAAISTSTTGVGYNRFYSIWAYGYDTERMFDETKTTDGTGYKTAAQFDSKRLTDRGTNAELVNVTCSAATNGRNGCTSVAPVALTSGKGWYLEYTSNLNERTAGSATVLASCAMWNTSSPTASTGSASACTVSNAGAYLYQADYITGAANCADSFKDSSGTYSRVIQRTIVAPPPEPAMVIAISKTTQQVRLSSVVIEPENNVGETVSTTSKDAAQAAYELPVSRSLHFCRHRGADQCVPTPP